MFLILLLGSQFTREVDNNATKSFHSTRIAFMGLSNRIQFTLTPTGQ